ncbi:hypothetical protein EYF80_060944 [Liparis tanakae]|uniref:Uncharacterized protein n=1 Tax=Liparis tanakae TaxID=230148 RepID=A0A4Z2EJG0_9TELE|nr:hypothetical protein EYF80_060944 [Liparis tanakae]
MERRRRGDGKKESGAKIGNERLQRCGRRPLFPGGERGGGVTRLPEDRGCTAQHGGRRRGSRSTPGGGARGRPPRARPGARRSGNGGQTRGQTRGQAPIRDRSLGDPV